MVGCFLLVGVGYFNYLSLAGPVFGIRCSWRSEDAFSTTKNVTFWIWIGTFPAAPRTQCHLLDPNWYFPLHAHNPVSQEILAPQLPYTLGLRSQALEQGLSSTAYGCKNKLLGTHRQSPPEPAEPANQVSWTTARDHPTTCAGGEYDMD